jgi:hypothetical protein
MKRVCAALWVAGFSGLAFADEVNLVRYQDIMHVLDLCQFEGVTRISIHARQ